LSTRIPAVAFAGPALIGPALIGAALIGAAFTGAAFTGATFAASQRPLAADHSATNAFQFDAERFAGNSVSPEFGMANNDKTSIAATATAAVTATLGQP
jgi:hypothetical protein